MYDSGYIFRRSNEIFFARKDIKTNKFIQKLFRISYNKNNFEIKPNKFEFKESGDIPTLNTAWFINRSSTLKNKSNKYKIKEGDIIKFGRIKLRIKKIVFNNINNNDGDNNIENKSAIENKDKNNRQKDVKENFSEKISQKKQKICRICYSEEEDKNNPLIQPCSCTGSLKYIHLSCLRQWLNTKSFIKVDSNSYCVSYLTKQAECELCKHIFPDYVFHDNKLFEIKNIESNFKNYLILESLTLDIHKNKFIYIISLDNPEHTIKVGRGKESDVLITDITVSRLHCKIIAENNNGLINIFIEDNNSKFGTLILIQTHTITMCENLNLNMQVGRSFITCRIKQKKNLLSCCNSEEKPDINYYFKQNNGMGLFSIKTTIKTEIKSIEANSEDYEQKISSKKKNKKMEENANNNENEIKMKDNQDKTTIDNMDKQIDNKNTENELKSNFEIKSENNIYEVSLEGENISENELLDISKIPQKPQK